jgi:tRNA pseudouridine38/39 synthase
MDKKAEYNRWTKEGLIKRVQELEARLHEREVREVSSTAKSLVTSAPTPVVERPAVVSTAEGQGELKSDKKKAKTDRKIDPSKYSTRMVAFKLAYLGKNYGGFEFQASAQLTTIEEELWRALVKSCLIFPGNSEEVQWEEWDYSKCGRTDRGVSAFGQVVALRVRSNRPLPKKPAAPAASAEVKDTPVVQDPDAEPAEDGAEEAKPFDDVADELPYCRILNRLLPPDIRILAWCPTTPADFSARHNCRERQYRYYFTQPAYSPIPASLENPGKRPRVKDGWLDIAAMRAAAKRFEGVHDFRNFCKIDPSKLITNFDRRIFECDIVEVEDAQAALPYLDGEDLRPSDLEEGRFPKVYYFHVRGSAFLWHQIRCMVALVFTVGQGLEDPCIIDQLLDFEKQPRRPNYTLASEYPLVLWDCIFPVEDDAGRKDDAMDWIYVGEENPLNQHGASGMVDHMWETWRERKMDEILSSQLLSVIAGQADISKRRDPRAPQFAPLSQRIFEGSNRERLVGKYQALSAKAKLPTPEETYDKEARRKGYADAAAWREARAAKREEALAAAAEVDDR